MSDLHGVAVANVSSASPVSAPLEEKFQMAGTIPLPTQEESREALPKLCPFPLWEKTILGKCASVRRYREVLFESGRTFDAWTRELFQRESFPCARQEIEVQLALRSVAELGFPSGGRYRDICLRAIELGLKLCVAEVGPALRLQYAGSGGFEWVGIGMRPITGWDSSLFIFALLEVPGIGLRLCGYYSHPDYFWDANHKFAFTI